MTDYTFETLNDKDFEILVVALLSKQFDKKIERFKSGKDQGIDGRFFEGNSNNQTVIIQCKHWLKTGITRLISECERTETTKVKNINPNRYIFVTSLPLSAKNKNDILNIFQPYIKHKSDILGQEDLNNLLKEYPDVERKHYKLYLTSINILQTVLDNDIIGRSDFHLKEIQEFLPKYVRTENHKESFKKLEELGSIVINGEPGIGKTTLAKQLCLDYVFREYELVVISDSIREAEKVYSLEKKQIFYFDDFLGSNFLLALDGNQDSNIMNFIRRVNKDSTKRFILTTRSNILNQGKILSESFDHNNIIKNEYEIKIQSLKPMDKARMLYNHIYFSDLPEKFIDEIYLNNRYIEIINHKNFNPRLIEFITDFIRIENLSGENSYWDYIQQSLNNPKDIWRGTIENQISQLDKHIVVAITLNNNSISEDELHFLLTKLKEVGFDNTSDFPTMNSIMRRLVGSILNRNILTNKRVNYSLFNPSIADFIISEYSSRTDYIAKLISCSRLSSTLLNIKKLSLSKLSSLDYDRIIENLVAIEIGNQNAYDLYTLHLIELTEPISINIIPLVEKFISINPADLFETFGIITLKMLQRAIELELISDFNKTHSLINDILDNVDLDADDLKYLSQLILVTPNNSSIIIKFRKCLISVFEESITDWAIDDDKFNNLFDEEITFDYDAYAYVDEILEEFECSSHITQEDSNVIANSIDFERIINHNNEKDYYAEMRAEEYRDYQTSESLTDPGTNPIEDLFQRH